MTVSKTPDAPEAPAGIRPELQQIIRAGRRPTSRSGSPRSTAVLAGASLLLLWLSFTPVEFAPAAWAALVPLILLVRLRRLPAGSYLILSLLGFLWAVATLQWMRLGHWAMYGALAALSVYLGLYIPLFVAISRRTVACGVPLWLAVPVVWTSLEYVRATFLTGFAWYFLSHTQYRWLPLIQICDLVGAYGVSFVIALFSAAAALQCPVTWLRNWGLDIEEQAVLAGAAPSSGRLWKRLRQSSLSPLLAALSVVALCCGYGLWRLSQTEKAFTAGPSFALIQGNFTPELKHDPDSFVRRYRIHDQLTRSCVALQPDFIVWPETMFPWPGRTVADGMSDDDLVAQISAATIAAYNTDREDMIRSWRSDEVSNLLRHQSQAVGSALIVGLEAHEISPGDLKFYNSAAFIRPDLGYVGRYDKMHRVVFGEYVPLKDTFPWLAHLTPFGPNYGIAAGAQPVMFEYGPYRIAPLICFEDTVPHLVRRIAGQTSSAGHGCDVLVNLTNDAWFRGSSELDQHLITAAFRCIETRTPLIRSVNGGISAFIDGNGQIREPAQILVMDEDKSGLEPHLTPAAGMRDPGSGRWRRQFSGIVFAEIPLDNRDSLYLRRGDWFAWLCLIAAVTATTASFFRQGAAAG